MNCQLIHKYAIAALAALMLPLMALAEIPAGYYQGLDGKAAGALKTAVQKAITPHTQLSYNSLWSEWRYTDVRPAPDNNQWWDMYSNNVYYVANGSRGMNREHSFPKSWWGGTQNSAYTDMNHLYPSDADANSAKNYYPLGEVSQATFDNGCTKVGYPKTGQGGNAGLVFEPDDQYKGDFARTYFYMVTMYQDYKWKYTFMVNQDLYPTLKPWAIELLLKWHRADPVSDKEINRNEGVYLRQGNRNPFIDHPELAEYIWGNHANETYYVSDTPITGDAVLVTPVQGTSFEFGEVAVGSSQTVYVTIKGQNIVGPLSVRSFGANASCFKISTNSLVASQVNSDDGVQLPIVYTPSSIGDHKSQIVIYDGGLSGSFTADLHGVGCEVPTMVAPVATDASDITDTSFTANWLAPEGITVDYYTLTLTTYNPGGENRTDEYTTESTYYAFSEMDASCTYSYSVTAHRLGYSSEPSNVITVGSASVANIDVEKGMEIHPIDGGVLISCVDVHTGCRIFNAMGQMVRMIPRLEQFNEIMLPRGVYFVVTDSMKKARRIVVSH